MDNRADNLIFYTPEEVAEILKISRQSVYNDISAGKLKAKKIGRRIRISKEDLEAYING